MDRRALNHTNNGSNGVNISPQHAHLLVHNAAKTAHGGNSNSMELAIDPGENEQRTTRCARPAVRTQSRSSFGLLPQQKLCSRYGGINFSKWLTRT